jgi:hypothetical protein
MSEAPPKPHPLLVRQRVPPLDVCPVKACRRAGRCLAEFPEYQCRKIAMEPNEWRYAMAAKVKRLLAEAEARNPRPPEKRQPMTWSEALPEIRFAMQKIRNERRAQAAMAARSAAAPEATPAAAPRKNKKKRTR